jgi:DNA-binding transcriptional LysR family regulator
MRMPDGVRQLDFNSYAMLVNAALAGQGVCLCWSGLLDSFLSTGAMVRLDGPSARSVRGYFITRRDGLAANEEVMRIHDWIVAEATIQGG